MSTILGPAVKSIKEGQPVARGWRVLLLAAALLTAFGVWAGGNIAGAAGKGQQDAVQVFNRDVFFIQGVTLRNPGADTDPSAPLFTDTGINLEMTWGDWQAATASSSVYVTGGRHPKTQVVIELSGLRPNGVYSVFYGTLTPDSENPLCPGVERTLPVTAQGSSKRGPGESSFIADANGTARYSGVIEGDLLAPLQSFFSIVYHFDGATYHPLPNKGEFLTQGENCRSSFGQDAMRQLLILQKGF